MRDPLGRYLGEVVKPGQTITSESSGYVGYYTNGTLYDWPGLESTTVVDAIRRGKTADPNGFANSLAGITQMLRPDWLVLRPGEAEIFAVFHPQILGNYRRVREFSVPGEQSLVSAQGFSVYNVDRDFIVYRRKS